MERREIYQRQDTKVGVKISETDCLGKDSKSTNTNCNSKRRGARAFRCQSNMCFLVPNLLYLLHGGKGFHEQHVCELPAYLIVNFPSLSFSSVALLRETLKASLKSRHRTSLPLHSCAELVIENSLFRHSLALVHPWWLIPVSFLVSFVLPTFGNNFHEDWLCSLSWGLLGWPTCNWASGHPCP